MAATTQYAGELKRLAGGSQAGRPLAKPVYHYTLSWGKDERPDRAEMEKAHTAEWAELRRRQERDPEGDQLQQHRERAELGREQGREAS